MKKLLPWLALGAALLWITGNPTGAAATIRHLITGLASFIHGL